MATVNQRDVARQLAAVEGSAVRTSAGAVVVGVCGLVLYGYMNFVAAAKPTWHSALPYVVGAVAAVVAFWLARATAVERFVAARLHGEVAPSAGMSWFALLLIVSAMGLMNSLFLLLEGDDVIARRLEVARKDFVELGQQGQAKLQIPEIEDKRTGINLGLKNLRQRIVEGRDPGNPNSNACGIGPDANAEFEALRKYLPQFNRLPLTNVHQCSQRAQLEKLYAAHEKVAWEQFKSLDLYRSKQVDRRDAMFAELPAFVTRAHELLQLRAAGGATSLASIRDRLGTAAKSYADKKAEVEALIGGELTSLPSRLDIDDVANIGNPGHAVKLLLKRWDHGLTWLIVGFAFFLDWLLVFAISRWFKHDVGVVSPRSVTSNQSSNTQVRYLWDEQTG